MTPATAVVADTQILIWYVIEPDRLSADAVAALEDATAADQPIYVSAHSAGALYDPDTSPPVGGASRGVAAELLGDRDRFDRRQPE